MWGAILITLVAAAGNNIGKALQKSATRSLPQINLARPEVLAQYLRHPVWLGGLLADLGGGLLMIAAFARAPVSVVQPVSSMGLVFMMLFSHFVLEERLSRAEWVAAAIASVGILCLGLSSEAPPPPPSPPTPSRDTRQAVSPAGAEAGGMPLQQQAAAGEGALRSPQVGVAGMVQDSGDAASALLVVVKLLLLLAVFGGWVAIRQRRVAAARRRRHSPHSAPVAAAAAAAGAGSGAGEAADAAWCGLEAGTCFGLSAAACRTGFQVSPVLGWPAVVGGLAASVGLTSCGFVLQTRGFKVGSMLVVCTLAAAAAMVSGVVVGLLALGEPLPSTWGRAALRWAAWALILVGVSRLASSGGGAAAGGPPPTAPVPGASSGSGPRKGGVVGGPKVVGAMEALVEGLHLPPALSAGLVGGLGVVLGGSSAARQRAGGGPRSCEDDGGAVLPTAHVHTV